MSVSGSSGRRVRSGVDVGGSLNLVGRLVKYLSVAFLFPVAVGLGYGDPVWPFLAASAITLAFGLALERATSGGETVGVREGFLVVTLTWGLAALAASIPYLLDEAQLASPLDAYFEAMSGMTTTGASVLTDIPAVDRTMLLWRALTQWLGGMGIIVLGLAVLPRLRVGGRQLLESELPGPEYEPLATSIRETARRLWLLYIGLTALLFLVLCALGWTGVDELMSPYQAIAHAFTTLPTGGFSPQARSIEPFAGATQWVAHCLHGSSRARTSRSSTGLFAAGGGRCTTRSCGCTWRSSSPERCSSSSSSCGRTSSRPGRRPFATRPSRPSRS